MLYNLDMNSEKSVDDFVEAVRAEVAGPFGKPTDVIGFSEVGKDVARALLPVIGEKEICFFDEEIKSDEVFHYLDFPDMLEKSEIMIFTVELPERYYECLERLNKKCKVFIPKKFKETIAVLEEAGCGDIIKI